jgi:TonB family protein
MKRFCYLLSIAGHALLLLIILGADFPIVIVPPPARVVAIEVAAPPPPFFATGPAAKPAGIGRTRPVARGAGSGKSRGAATAGGSGGGPVNGAGGLSFPQPAKFALKRAPQGAFSLPLAGKAAGLPAGSELPSGPPRLTKFSAAGYDPGIPMGGNSGRDGVFLVPFDIKEKAVAAWTEAVLARIERNWLIPAAARLAFSGQVQITLTVEKNGSQQALAMEDSSLPEAIAQSALQAVQASLPLPPLPENVAGQTFAFTFVFDFNG